MSSFPPYRIPLHRRLAAHFSPEARQYRRHAREFELALRNAPDDRMRNELLAAARRANYLV